MKNTRINLEMIICDIVLNMERPFKISQFLREVDRYGITNKDLALDILNQMCESGAVKYSEVEDDVWKYKVVAQYA